MNFPSKAILLLYIALSPLLVLSSSAIVTADKEEKTNKNLLRGSLVEDTLPTKTDENGVGIEDSHNRDDVPMIEASVEEPVLPLSSSNKFGNENISIYNGVWGGWQNWVKIDKGGLYACGAELRFEGSQGGGDDTAANGLKLTYCGLTNWRSQEEQQIYGGIWGSWTGRKMCPYGKYIGAASVRFEDPIGGGDDTALNGLLIWCVDKHWRNGEAVMVYAGIWGSWKPWGYKVNKLVKGAIVRFEGSQGGGDDTAMNGIWFNVERPNYSISQQTIVGSWISLASGPQGRFSYKVTESTSTTHGEQVTEEEAYGIETSISAGFTFKAFDFSASVKTSQSRRTATTVSSSLTQFKAIEIMHACPETGSPTGYYTMWQFVMKQSPDSYGAGFDTETSHIRCTPSYSQQPKCPLGSCNDKFCQKCKTN